MIDIAIFFQADGIEITLNGCDVASFLRKIGCSDWERFLRPSSCVNDDRKNIMNRSEWPKALGLFAVFFIKRHCFWAQANSNSTSIKGQHTKTAWFNHIIPLAFSNIGITQIRTKNPVSGAAESDPNRWMRFWTKKKLLYFILFML